MVVVGHRKFDDSKSTKTYKYTFFPLHNSLSHCSGSIHAMFCSKGWDVVCIKDIKNDVPHGCESFALWHSRTHIPATTRNFCALPFIFVIVNIGADFLLVLNLVALHCKWHANETSPKLYPLTKGELSMFYFLDSFFVCVIRFRFHSFRVLHCWNACTSYIFWFIFVCILFILYTPKTLFTISTI